MVEHFLTRWSYVLAKLLFAYTYRLFRMKILIDDVAESV